MLELRPSCEHCRCALPPASTKARICSFECTFCADCVAKVLHDTCPNCGGGFAPRPVRPQHNWHDNNCLATYPAGSREVHRPVDERRHAALLAAQAGLAADER